MLRIDVYPVMDGVEVWVAAMCRRPEHAEADHKGAQASTYISRERLDQNGLEAVVGFEVGAILTEFPEVAARGMC